MPGQGLAHLLNCLDDGFGESALLHQVTHPGADLLPECVAALFVNAQVAHNRELARARDQVDQDRVAMTGFGHAQFEEPLLRKYQRVGPLAVRNINANFAGAFALSLGDCLDDSGFVQLADKFFRSHVVSPASARATTAGRPADTGTTAAANTTATPYTRASAPRTPASSAPPATVASPAAPMVHWATPRPDDSAQDRNHYDQPEEDNQ